MKRLPLTQGRFTVVDDNVYKWASAFKWCVVSGGYASRTTSRKLGKSLRMTLHREILKLPYGDRWRQVDHINGDRLDNRRKNLRVASPSQNAAASRKAKSGTSSKFRGVCWHKHKQKWFVRIAVNGKRIQVGYFSNERIAARAYDAATRKFFGEFASPNFP